MKNKGLSRICLQFSEWNQVSLKKHEGIDNRRTKMKSPTPWKGKILTQTGHQLKKEEQKRKSATQFY